jgi:hypothetical protein
MARKPSAIARELLRNFPKGGKRRRKGGNKQAGQSENRGRNGKSKRSRRGGSKARGAKGDADSGSGEVDLAGTEDNGVAVEGDGDEVPPVVDAVGDS